MIVTENFSEYLKLTPRVKAMTWIHDNNTLEVKFAIVIELQNAMPSPEITKKIQCNSLVGNVFLIFNALFIIKLFFFYFKLYFKKFELFLCSNNIFEEIVIIIRVFIETRAILNLSLLTYSYFPFALPCLRVNKLVYV